MDIRKMIGNLREQAAKMQTAITALEEVALMESGRKKRGRPPLPKCEHGCGRPKHRGKCRGFKALAQRQAQ